MFPNNSRKIKIKNYSPCFQWFCSDWISRNNHYGQCGLVICLARPESHDYPWAMGARGYGSQSHTNNMNDRWKSGSQNKIRSSVITCIPHFITIRRYCVFINTEERPSISKKIVTLRWWLVFFSNTVFFN